MRWCPHLKHSIFLCPQLTYLGTDYGLWSSACTYTFSVIIKVTFKFNCIFPTYKCLMLKRARNDKVASNSNVDSKFQVLLALRKGLVSVNFSLCLVEILVLVCWFKKLSEVTVWLHEQDNESAARCCSGCQTLDRSPSSLLYFPFTWERVRTSILTFVFLFSRWLVNPNMMSESTKIVPRSMTLGLDSPSPGDPDEFGKDMV